MVHEWSKQYVYIQRTICVVKIKSTPIHRSQCQFQWSYTLKVTTGTSISSVSPTRTHTHTRSRAFWSPGVRAQRTALLKRGCPITGCGDPRRKPDRELPSTTARSQMKTSGLPFSQLMAKPKGAVDHFDARWTVWLKMWRGIRHFSSEDSTPVRAVTTGPHKRSWNTQNH